MIDATYEQLANDLRYPSDEEPEKQELFTRTFDIQAPCCLEVGYAVFGEDYKRGHLLVQLQGLHRKFDNACGTELADHLTNILTLLPKIAKADFDETRDFVSFIVLPGVEKMLEAFKDEANPYRSLLATVFKTIQDDFDPEWTNPWPKKSTLDLPSYTQGKLSYDAEEGRLS